MAKSLIGIGLHRGDRVGIWATNCYEWILTQYATGMAGLILVNINPAYKTHELEYSLNKVECKAIIMSESNKNQNYLKMIHSMAPELDHCQVGQLNAQKLPFLRSVIIIGNNDHP